MAWNTIHDYINDPAGFEAHHRQWKAQNGSHVTANSLDQPLRDQWMQGMTTEQMIKEAYRRGGAAMFDMMRGGLSFTEAWRRLSEAAAMETPPNLKTMLEEIRAREEETEVP